MTLKAPFPAIGGKSRIAARVWELIGHDVDNAIEPFCFSAAWMLNRPGGARGYETLNDMNPFVSNFWRATTAARDDVARHCLWPVNETDLHARHDWLMTSDAAREFKERMRAGPEYYDAKIAGWWCWGACNWIGTGFCCDSGLTKAGRASTQLPRLGDAGVGVCRPMTQSQIPHPSSSNHGVRKMTSGRPQLADKFSRGRGVMSNDSAITEADRLAWLMDWLGRLRDRLMPVRVCCGDWLRVCDSPSVTTRLGVTGIFADPPYAHAKSDGTNARDTDLYDRDSPTVAADVRRYCLERGGNRMYRIVLCGLDDEHDELLAHGWTKETWKATGGYGNQRADGTNNNRHLERLWISPHCLREKGLFE